MGSKLEFSQVGRGLILCLGGGAEMGLISFHSFVSLVVGVGSMLDFLEAGLGFDSFSF